MREGLLVVALIGVGCSSSGDAGDAEDATTPGDTGSVEADASAPDPRITCENACARAPRCEGDLIDLAGCMALCQQEADGEFEYACCIQHANDCNQVGNCIKGLAGACDESGEPWVPLEYFDDCECTGLIENADDPVWRRTHECKDVAADLACPIHDQAMCFKPANSKDPAFCTVDCGLDPGTCPEGTRCTKTPISSYCERE